MALSQVTTVSCGLVGTEGLHVLIQSKHAEEKLDVIVVHAACYSEFHIEKTWLLWLNC